MAQTQADKVLLYWEGVLALKEKKWKEVWGGNKTLGPIIYLNDVVPYKHIVRYARLQANQPICWGVVDCLEKPLTRCAAGKHETCRQHGNDCFLCKNASRT